MPRPGATYAANCILVVFSVVVLPENSPTYRNTAWLMGTSQDHSVTSKAPSRVSLTCLPTLTMVMPSGTWKVRS